LHAFDPATTMWYEAPADVFTQSLPLGSGRLGAMVFGGIREERVILNEISVWSGAPDPGADRTDAYQALPEIRRLLLEGRNAEADQAVNQHFTCAGKGSGNGNGADAPYGCYQTLGDLRLDFALPDGAVPSRYRRTLDLRRARALVEYEYGGVVWSREALASAPDEAIVLRLTASRPGRISFSASLSRPQCASTRAVGADELLMAGRLNNGTDGEGMRFAARLRAVATGGTVAADGDRLHIQGADEVLLLITAATDYVGFAGR